jgi:hypothetical protein
VTTHAVVTTHAFVTTHAVVTNYAVEPYLPSTFPRGAGAVLRW